MDYCSKEAMNDVYIYDLIKSGHFKTENGILYTRLSVNGKSVKDVWRSCGGPNLDGYQVVNLRRFGGQKGLYVHRIIYAFHHKFLNPLKTIHHKNHNRSDNRIENLEEVSWYMNLKMKRGRIYDQIY